MLGLVTRIALVVIAAWIFYRLLIAKRGGGGGSFKCATCRHCGTLSDDGVLCRFGRTETFKNTVHISNCMDYERRA